MKHGAYGAGKVMPNNKMHYISTMTAPTAKAIHNPNHAKSLVGVTIDCGYGGQTNTDFQVQHSRRGMKDAMSPKGPSGGGNGGAY